MARNIENFGSINANATGVWFWYSIDGGKDVRAHFAEAFPRGYGVALSTTAQGIHRALGSGAVSYGFQVSNLSPYWLPFDLVSGGLT